MAVKLSEVIKALVELGERDQGGKYFEIAQAVALIFPRHLREQLTQLVKGPVWDGDVICKSHRGELFEMGLAIRVCCKGEQGHTGAKYIAYSILKMINEIEEERLNAENKKRAMDFLSPLRPPDAEFTRAQNAKIDAHTLQEESDFKN